MQVIVVIVASVLITGIITTSSKEKDNVEKEEFLSSTYVFRYAPEILLPEIIVGNQTIWGQNVNLTDWYKLPYPEIFIEKYQNHSKELIEIMKMQVALLGEDPDLFEKCIYSIKEINEFLQNETTTCLPLWAHKKTFQGGGEGFEEYNGKEVWELTFSFGEAGELIVMYTYYVDVDTFEPFPFVIGTD